MKRFLGLLICVVILSGSVLFANVSVAEDIYSNEFDELFNRIEEFVEKAQYVASINVLIWDEEGPSMFSSILTDMISADSFEDMMWDPVLKEIFSYKAESVYEQYTEYYFALLLEGDEIKQELKVFKDEYEDSHDDAVEALKDYYTKAVSYGEFATSPSGNLINYTSNFSAFETELDELKSDAEFEK